MTHSTGSQTTSIKNELAWIQLYDWADATTQSWAQQTKMEHRRKKRCDVMVRIRAQKKKEKVFLRTQIGRLELQLKQIRASWDRTASAKDADEILVAIHRLALESDSLRTENMELFEKLQHLERLQSIVHQLLLDTTNSDEQDPPSVNVYEAGKKAKWNTSSKVSGWRVYFPNGAPSFYFHPFTFEDFNETITMYDEMFGVNPPFIKLVGEMLGWKMHCTPLVRRPDQSLVTHARFTTRFNCSLTSINESMMEMGVKTLPLIVTPPQWNTNHREEVSVDILQKFEKDAYVVVCNIPGPVHYRFLYFLRMLTRTTSNGKRSISYIMTIANSKANQRSRIEEELPGAVNWVQEGGTFVTITEVDDETADMTYDHWTSCTDERHGQSLFIEWAHFVSRWSQIIRPSRLLEAGNEEV